MKRLLSLAPILAASLLLGNGPATAHDGRLDANGCHYDHSNGEYHCHKDVAPNPDINAPVKKSRENVCHDAHSPSYRTVRYFVSYRNMASCLASGGREPNY